MTLGPAMGVGDPVVMKHLKPSSLPSAPIDAGALDDAAGAARYWGGLAIATLAQIASDAAAPAMARVAAASRLLDRGFGPVIPYQSRAHDFSHISDDKLDEMVRRLEKTEQDSR